MKSVTPDIEREDLQGLARGGALNLVGSAFQAVFAASFLLVITRGLGASGSGALLEAIALFNILAATATLGVDTGFIYSLSRMRSRNLVQDMPTVYRVGYIPLAVLGIAAAVVVLVMAEPLAKVLGNESHAAEIASYLRVMAMFIPLAALQVATLGATRAYETMVPTVLIDSIAKLGLQLMSTFLAVYLGFTHRGTALAWSTPILITLIWAIWWRTRLDNTTAVDPTSLRTPTREVLKSFWVYTLPRSFASIFRTGVQWLDVLLVGALLSPGAAGVYGVATRLLQFGLAVAYAVGQVSQPMIGRLYSAGEHAQTKALFSVATSWQILLSWPQYIVVALFAMPILSIFGSEFIVGAEVAAVLAMSTMVGSAAGPVDMVLLMAGKSMWSFWNTAISLTVNVVFNLALIPQMGILGAAVAWTAARIVANVLPSIQVASHLKLHPFSRSWFTAVAITLAAFGLTGLGVRVWVGNNASALILCLSAAVLVFVGALYLYREPLQLRVAVQAFATKLRPGYRRTEANRQVG